MGMLHVDGEVLVVPDDLWLAVLLLLLAIPASRSGADGGRGGRR